MHPVAVTEFLSCLFVGISFVSQCFANDGAVSSWRMRVCTVMTCVWLLADAFSYEITGPVLGSLLPMYAANFFSFVIGSITMIAFMAYADSYIREQTPLGRWVFRVPMLVAAGVALVIAHRFLTGRMLSFGTEQPKLIGGIPMPLMAVLFVLLFYPTAVAFLKHRFLGWRAVAIISVYSFLPGIAVALTLVLENDFSPLAAAIAVTIVAELLQHRRINAKHEEVERMKREMLVITVKRREEESRRLGRFRPMFVELLKLFSGDFGETEFARALEILREGTGASRAYLLKYDRERGMLRLLGEARKDASVQALETGFEYSAARERGWEKVTDDNFVRAPDAFDPNLVGKYGLLSDVNRQLGIRSLYVVRFAVGGRNWGSVGITYEGQMHDIDEYEWEFLQVAASMLQLSAVHGERRMALEQERDRARSAEQAKSYFFSSVSHDIRTPLNAIIGYAELLKLGMADKAEQAKAIDSVLVSGHTLLELINDVLDLSKLEAGKMEILPEPVNPTRLVEEVADAFRATLGGKPVEIRTVLGTMPWLKLDPQRIRQILFNLVGNAVKFTDSGYVEVSAGYERGEGGRGLFRFAVKDTGCGISEEDMIRVAQPYVQVGIEASRGKGTGLGLAICNQLVDRMGGEIILESKLGRGTTFTVEIPQVEEDDEARRVQLSTTQRIRLAVEEKAAVSVRVLVVDDVAMNRMVLKSMMRKFGITDVETAENGFGALKLMNESGPFDLVLTDMWMPGMDGERLVGEIRKNPAWAKLPVYAVTADVEAQKGYSEMGFSGLLLKPLTLEKLREFFHTNM